MQEYQHGHISLLIMRPIRAHFLGYDVYFLQHQRGLGHPLIQKLQMPAHSISAATNWQLKVSDLSALLGGST